MALAAIAAAATIGAAVPGSAGQANQLRFADGKYSGTLVYLGKISATGVSAKAGAKGTFELTVNGGQVTGGAFTVSGDGSSLVPGGGAIATFSASGGFDGTSAKPDLRPQSAALNGQATVEGFTVPFAFNAGPSELGHAPLNIESATCSLVVGDFVQQLSQALTNQGISNDLYGRFVATRTGDAVGGVTALGDLLVEADAIISAAASGNVDAAKLLAVVEKAYAFSTSLAKNTKCGTISQAGKFNTVLTGLIADLLDVMITNPDAFDASTMFLLLQTGVSVGAIGEGATDEAFSKKILANAEQIFEEKLSKAIGSGDKTEIQHILLAAESLGWNAIAKKAQGAL